MRHSSWASETCWHMRETESEGEERERERRKRVKYRERERKRESMWLYNARMYYRRCSSHAAGTLYHRRHPCGRDLPSRCHNHARTETWSRRSTFDRSRGLIKGKLLRGFRAILVCPLESAANRQSRESDWEFLLEKVGNMCMCVCVYIAKKKEGKDTR